MLQLSVKLSSSSEKEKGGVLSQLPAMQSSRSLKNGEANHNGKLFNQNTTDRVKPER